MITWQRSSEIVTGLVLTGRLGDNSVMPSSLMPPYNEVIEQHKKNGGDITQLIELCGLDPIQNALQAAETVNGTSKLADFIAMLERTKNNYVAGELLERYSNKLQQGESVDWSKIASIAAKAQAGIGNGFTPLNQITPMEIPFKKTGFVALDKHFGGLPAIGQVLVGASPGVGKTTFMLQLVSCWVKEHPDEVVIIYTLEMLKEELKMRLTEVYKLSDEEQSRILVEDMPMTPEETISKTATIEHVGMICVDFADLLIQGETTESEMSHIYRVYMLGAKSLKVTAIILCQLSRNYAGGIPRPHHIRWTGLAEALAWGLIMLYNPSTNWFSDTEDDDILPMVKNHAYIIGWKFRGGFRVHAEDSPGAIQIPFIGAKGWHYKHDGIWFPIKDGMSKKKSFKR